MCWSLAQDGIRTLYDAISATDHPKAQIFFSQWKILFGEVCGYDSADSRNALKCLMEDLELFSIFRYLNITNFLEGDLLRGKRLFGLSRSSAYFVAWWGGWILTIRETLSEELLAVATY